MTYASRQRRLLDRATGEPICRRCYADIRTRGPQAVFCTEQCRNRAKAKRQRAAARKGRKPWLYRNEETA